MHGFRLSRLWSAWPLLASLGIYGVVLCVLFASIRDINGGYFGYYLDDASIHMAIAKNFALHGVWGVTPYAFSAASSSPLWTMLLAGWFRVFGVNTFAPLFLTVVGGFASLVVAWRILLRLPLPQTVRAFALLAALLFSKLPLLVFSGMEHVLQLLFVLVFLLVLLHTLQSPSSRIPIVCLLATAPLLMLTRYESFTVIFITSIIFSVRRRWRMALLLLVVSAIGPALFGLWTIANGGEWLPNSVIIKGIIAAPSAHLFSVRFLWSGLKHFFATPIPSLLVLLLVAYFRFLKMQKQTIMTSGMMLLIIASSMMFLQIFGLARNPEGRYFDYIIFLALLACATPLWDVLKHIRGTRISSIKRLLVSASCIGLIALMVHQLTLASVLYYRYTPIATRNIYEQQHQMGRFFAQYYHGRGVALNDIGEVSYQADIQLLDVWGLADNDVMKMRLQRRYTPEALAKLARERHVSVAAVYDGWFTDGFIMTGGVPKEWGKVGTWTIRNNIVAASSTVDFYAVDPAESKQLARNLRAFEPELPAGVIQKLFSE